MKLWFIGMEVMILGRFDTYEMLGKSAFSKVLAGIDMDLMENDMEYLKTAVTELFSHSRVQRYLENGMKSIEELEHEAEVTGSKSLWPCGEYIGKLIKDESGDYRKIFDTDVGMWSHTSPELEGKRQSARNWQRTQKQSELQKRLKEIEELKAELEEEENEI